MSEKQYIQSDSISIHMWIRLRPGCVVDLVDSQGCAMIREILPVRTSLDFFN
jgi:hypothetical protein